MLFAKRTPHLKFLVSDFQYVEGLDRAKFITAIENIRFEIYLRLFEFKHTESFTSHGCYYGV